MKRFHFIMLALMLDITIVAQDRLFSSSHIGNPNDYHIIVDDKMGINDKNSKWCFLCRPSFAPEYSVFCYVNNYGAYLVANTADRSIWKANDKNGVEVLRDTLRISRDLASNIDALFRIAVESSSFLPFDHQTFIDETGKRTLLNGVSALDGNTYVFLSDRRIAECWTQPFPSISRNLIQIGDSLYSAVKRSDVELINKMQNIINETKQAMFAQMPDWYPEYLEAKTNDSWRIYFSKSPFSTEPTHMHLSIDSNVFVLEMNEQKFRGDKKAILDYVNEFRSNNLLIIDDGKMTWNDALEIADRVSKKEGGHTTVIMDVRTKKYWKERGVDVLISVLPNEARFEAKNKKLIDVVLKQNARYTSDYEKKGKFTLHPNYDNINNAQAFYVYEIITMPDELLVLYKSDMCDFFAYPLDIAILANGKEYNQTNVDGMEDWEYHSGQQFFKDCSEHFCKVYCAHFPALPKEISKIDIVDVKNKQMLIEGLKITK